MSLLSLQLFGYCGDVGDISSPNVVLALPSPGSLSSQLIPASGTCDLDDIDTIEVSQNCSVFGADLLDQTTIILDEECSLASHADHSGFMVIEDEFITFDDAAGAGDWDAGISDNGHGDWL
ncbi:hypothetical protein KJY73_21445 [Bowmanella sp. Y26]|uniref:hypothetical protein n=1 Tax=Bowmanella yangjiangensis TaxID=2811230 RepID=UPI001BDD9604|nr:hypothetical protein [Bowmanella yangjiangensis]MBT1066155.1 hypothetical protein [Bowmanella yangjiangensis]